MFDEEDTGKSRLIEMIRVWFRWNNRENELIMIVIIKGSQLQKFHGYSKFDLAAINILSNWPAHCENHQIQNRYNDFLQERHELMTSVPGLQRFATNFPIETTLLNY